MNPTTLNLLAVSVFAFTLLSLVGPLLNISPGAVATVMTAVAGVFALDRFVAKGVGGNLLIDLCSRQSSEYRQRIIHHEAGHFLVAHLLDIPVQSYTLSAWEAIRAGFPGLGGVIVDTAVTEPDAVASKGALDTTASSNAASSNAASSDAASSDVVAGNAAPNAPAGPSARLLNQYCVVWMAGIAAESRQFGSVQGGEDDKFRLKQLWQQIPVDERANANVETQTRWALLQAKTLIETQQAAYQALVAAMTDRKPVETCAQQIDANRIL